MPNNTPPNTFYLIDGFAQMFRSYFAIRGGMTSPVTGEPTNATFAFTDMLLKIYRDYQPAYLAMAMESEGDTFRDGFYPEYKANRDPAPDDFKAQVPRMIEIAKLFGVVILQAEGYEADDIMATLAVQTQRGDFDPPEDDAGPPLMLRMVSKDKDLEQVLSDRAVLFDAHKDELIDADALLAKKGITPAQAIDYQTLIGDSTDNVPGVKGIGPKTASMLLNQFGSVDEICKNLDQLKGKQKENIQHAFDEGLIDLSRRLVTMATDVEFGFDLNDAATKGTAKIDGDRLQELFRELGFNRMQGDLAKLLGKAAPEASTAKTPSRQDAKQPPQKEQAGFGLFADLGKEEAPTTAPRPANENYRAVRTADELNKLVDIIKQQPLVAIDTETIGLGHSAELCGICLAWQEGAGVYIPTRSPDQDSHLDTPEALDILRPWLEDASAKKCGHNIKYDDLVLRHAGVVMKGVVFDSMIGGFLANAPGIGMDDLALSELGHECIPISELIGPRPRRKADPPQKTMDQVPLERVTQYAAEDADITLRLCNKLRARLDGQGMTELYEKVEMPLVGVLATMEQHGITVNASTLDAQRDKLQARIEELRSDILTRAKADFNPDSPKQLGEVLFNQLGFKAIKKTKTGFSTDSEVLEKLAALTPDEVEGVDEAARQIPGAMIEYRMLTKLVGTYLVALKDAIADPATGGDGRVHARFNQTGAATGRLSSSDPNLQNIPIRTEVGRDIRKAFIAEPGSRLIAADYSQIELRVLAHLSEDEALIDAFNAGEDIHRAVAAQVFGVEPEDVDSEQRGRAKVINFGIIYGITAFGLARRIDGLDNKAAAALIDDYKARFPGIDTFLDTCVQKAQEDGYVETILGRRRVIDGIHERNPNRRALAERLAINSVVQGSAADLIKVAMVNLQQRIEREQLPCKLLLQIHDELVIEAPADQADAMAEVLMSEMRSAMALKVPLDVEAGIGEDWFGAK